MQKVIRWILPAIQAVISAALMVMLVTSGLLPGKYMGIAAGVIVLMLIITVLFASAGNGVVRSIGGVLAIFMCGMLVFGMVYLRQIRKTLDSIAGSDLEVKCIAVLWIRIMRPAVLRIPKATGSACMKVQMRKRSEKRSKKSGSPARMRRF